MRRWIAAAVLVLLALPTVGALTVAHPRVAPMGKVYSVRQFLVQVTAGLPAHKPRSGQVYRVRGILMPDHGLPEYVLSDSSTNMGIGLQAVPLGLTATLLRLRRIPALRPLLRHISHTADNPLLGKIATYRVAWAPCSRYPHCNQSPQGPWGPWRLVSGGD